MVKKNQESCKIICMTSVCKCVSLGESLERQQTFSRASLCVGGWRRGPLYTFLCRTHLSCLTLLPPPPTVSGSSLHASPRSCFSVGPLPLEAWVLGVLGKTLAPHLSLRLGLCNRICRHSPAECARASAHGPPRTSVLELSNHLLEGARSGASP